MSTVERRILEIIFDNTRFERAVRASMQTLDDFYRKLEMRGATEGFDRVERRLDNFSFKGLRKGIEGASEEFTKFGETAAKNVDDLAAKFDKIDGANIGRAFHNINGQLDLFIDNAIFGIDGIQDAADEFSLGNMSDNLDYITEKFTNMGIVGMSVLNNLANRATDWLADKVMALPSAVFGAGYTRAQNIENARFTMQGILADADQVEAAMGKASDSVYNTAYSLDQAASAASMFVASGMDVEELDKALGAVAGTAATANADYASMAHIFTTIYGQGRLMGQQLTQMATYGVNAAADLRNAFQMVVDSKPGANLVDYGGEINQQIRDAYFYGVDNIEGFLDEAGNITEYGIRELVSKGMIGADEFMAVFNKRYAAHAKDAQKTFTGSLANIRASLARIGEMFFTDLIQQEGPLVQLFNTIRDALVGVSDEGILGLKDAIEPLAHMWTNLVNGLATGAEKILKAFTYNGGFAAIANIVQGFVNILGAIGYAIRDAFNLGDGSLADLVGKLAANFLKFTEALKPTEKGLGRLRGVLTVVLKVFNYIWEAVKFVFDIIVSLGKVAAKALAPVGKILQQLASHLGELVGSFADWISSFSDSMDAVGFFEKLKVLLDNLVGSISDWITKSYQAIRQSNAFESLKGVWEAILGLIDSAKQKLQEFVEFGRSGVDRAKSIAQGLGEYTQQEIAAVRAHGGLQGAWEKSSGVLDKLKEKLSVVGEFFKRIGSSIVEGFKNIDFSAIWAKISKAFTMENMSKFFLILDQAIASGFSIMFLGVLNNVRKAIGSLGELFDAFASALNTVTEALNKFLNKTNDSATKFSVGKLIAIAIAIGILALSLRELAKLNLKEIGTGLAGILGIFTMMTGFLMMFSPERYNPQTGKKNKFKGLLKGAAFEKGFILELIGLAAVIYILAAALSKIAKLDIGNMYAALGVIAGLFAIIGVFTSFFTETEVGKDKDGKPIMKPRALRGAEFAKFGQLIILAAAIYLLAKAIAKIGELDPARMYSALGVVSILLVVLGLFSLFVGGGSFNSSSSRIASGGKGAKYSRGLKSASFKGITAGNGVGVILSAIGMAAAVYLLGKAIAKLGELDQNTLIQGGITAGLIITALTIFEYVTGKGAPKAKAGAFASLVGLCIALMVIAHYIEVFGKMPLPVLMQGGIAIMAIIAILGLFELATGYGDAKSKVGAFGSLVGLCIALIVIAHYIEFFGTMDQAVLIQGGIAIAAIIGALLLYVLGLGALSKSMASVSFKDIGKTLLLLGAATVSLSVVALSLTPLAGQPWQSILSAAVAVIAILVVVMGGLFLLSKMGDAKKLLEVATVMGIVFGSIALLTTSMAMLAAMPTKGIWTAMGAILILVAGITLLGAIIGVVKPIAAGLAVLGSACLMIGSGMMYAGIGVALFAGGLSLLIVTLVAAGPALIGQLQQLITLMPYFAKKLGESFVSFAHEVGKGRQAFAEGFTAIFGGILDGLKALTGDIVEFAVGLIMEILDGIVSALQEYLPKLTDKLMTLITDMFNTMAEHVGPIGEAFRGFMIAVVDDFAANAGDFTDHCMAAITEGINGIADAINNRGPELNEAFNNLGVAIRDFLIDAVETAFGEGGVFDLSKLFKFSFGGSDPEEEGESASSGFLSGVGRGAGTFFMTTGLGGTFKGLGSLVGGLWNSVFGNGDRNTPSSEDNRLNQVAQEYFASDEWKQLMDEKKKEWDEKWAEWNTKAQEIYDSHEHPTLTDTVFNKKKELEASEEYQSFLDKLEEKRKAGAELMNGFNKSIIENVEEAKNRPPFMASIFDQKKEFEGSEEYQTFLTDLEEKRKAGAELMNGINKSISDNAEEAKNRPPFVASIFDQKKEFEASEEYQTFIDDYSNKADDLSTAGQAMRAALGFLPVSSDITPKIEGIKTLYGSIRESSNVAKSSKLVGKGSLADQTNEFANSLKDAVHNLEQIEANLDPAAIADALSDPIINMLNYKTQEFNTVGLQHYEAYVKGVEGQRYEVVNTGKTLAVEGSTGAKQASGKYVSAGTSGASSYVSGISANSWSGSYNKGYSLAGQARSGAGAVSFYDTGVNTGAGFANGLRDTIGRASTAAGALAEAAKIKLKIFLGIGSPSKVFHQYGEWTGEGFANGMHDSIPLVAQATESIGEVSVNTIKDAFNDLAYVADDLLDISENPTITPVVDMTNVNAAKNQLSSIFSQNAMLGRLNNMTQSVAYSFSGYREPANINRVTSLINGGEDAASSEAYQRIIEALDNQDGLTAAEVRALREDILSMDIRLDSGELVGGLVSNSRRRAAMNV